MSEPPFATPNGKPGRYRRARRRGRVFAFTRASDGVRFRCELSLNNDHVEAQLFINDQLVIRQQFTNRALAIQWANVERECFEKGGERL